MVQGAVGMIVKVLTVLFVYYLFTIYHVSRDSILFVSSRAILFLMMIWHNKRNIDSLCVGNGIIGGMCPNPSKTAFSLGKMCVKV